jgi:hypothetical protein
MTLEKFAQLKNCLLERYEEVRRDEGVIDDGTEFMIKIKKDGPSCLIVGVAQEDNHVVLVNFGKASDLPYYRDDYQEVVKIIEGLGIKWKLG